MWPMDSYLGTTPRTAPAAAATKVSGLPLLLLPLPAPSHGEGCAGGMAADPCCRHPVGSVAHMGAACAACGSSCSKVGQPLLKGQIAACSVLCSALWMPFPCKHRHCVYSMNDSRFFCSFRTSQQSPGEKVGLVLIKDACVDATLGGAYSALGDSPGLPWS